MTSIVQFVFHSRKALTVFLPLRVEYKQFNGQFKGLDDGENKIPSHIQAFTSDGKYGLQQQLHIFLNDFFEQSFINLKLLSDSG